MYVYMNIWILFPTHHFTVFSFWCSFVNCAWSCGLKKSCERQGDPKYAPPSDGRQKNPMLPTMVSVVSNVFRFVFQKTPNYLKPTGAKQKKHILHTLCMVETEPCNKLPKHSLPEWLQKAGLILINCKLKETFSSSSTVQFAHQKHAGNPTLSNRKGTWKQPFHDFPGSYKVVLVNVGWRAHLARLKIPPTVDTWPGLRGPFFVEWKSNLIALTSCVFIWGIFIIIKIIIHNCILKLVDAPGRG